MASKTFNTRIAHRRAVPFIAFAFVAICGPPGGLCKQTLRQPISLSTRGGSTFSSRFAPKKVSSPLEKLYSQQQQQQNTDATAATKDIMDAFLTRDSRNSFVTRVYAILSAQLLVTAASIVLFGLRPELREFLRPYGAAVPGVGLLLSTACWLIMCISSTAKRTSPLKWQLLVGFTLGEALSVGFLSSFYKFQSVISAMLATALAATSISVYTATQRNPKYDLSQWGAGLSSCGMIFVAYGLLSLLQMVGVLPAGFLPYNETLYGLCGACLFSFYLAHHTKLIVSGKNTKYQLNEKDYVFGAMMLYNDIINLFLYTLRLFGEDKDSH